MAGLMARTKSAILESLEMESVPPKRYINTCIDPRFGTSGHKQPFPGLDIAKLT